LWKIVEKQVSSSKQRDIFVLDNLVKERNLQPMAKVKKDRKQVTMAPTPEDEKLFAELKRKLGVSEADIIRLGIRALAVKEGVAA
jgi:hypothetical protein